MQKTRTLLPALLFLLAPFLAASPASGQSAPACDQAGSGDIARVADLVKWADDIMISLPNCDGDYRESCFTAYNYLHEGEQILADILAQSQGNGCTTCTLEDVAFMSGIIRNRGMILNSPPNRFGNDLGQSLINVDAWVGLPICASGATGPTSGGGGGGGGGGVQVPGVLMPTPGTIPSIEPIPAPNPVPAPPDPTAARCSAYEMTEGVILADTFVHVRNETYVSLCLRECTDLGWCKGVDVLLGDTDFAPVTCIFRENSINDTAIDITYANTLHYECK